MLFSLVIFLNNGCKPKDCNKDGSCAELHYRAKFDDLKKYLYALQGSYWIYKNTKTAELDTQTCISFYYDSIKVRGTDNNTKYITLEYDKFSRVIYSTFYKTSIFDESIDLSANAINSNTDKAFVKRIVYGVGSAYSLIHPFQAGFDFDGGASITKCQGLDSTLTVQGKTYYSVAKFDIDFDYTWDDINYTGGVYYWAKDVGIIKHTHKVGKYSWELTDYKIIK